MVRKNTAIRSVTFHAAICLIFVSSASGEPSLTPLGDLSGGAISSSAYGVSGDGSVVVGRSSSASGNQAFRWTRLGGMVGLGDLAGGTFSSSANGISADGTIIVGVSNSASGSEAFRWTASGGMMGLGDVVGGNFGSSANAISRDGSTIVGYGTTGTGPTAVTRPIRWTSSEGMIDLRKANGGSMSGQAYDVSADGSVVVGYAQISANEAFRWTDATKGVSLGSFPGSDNAPIGPFSQAMAVTADGSLVFGTSNSYLGYKAVQWKTSIGMSSLGEDAYSTVRATTPDGSVLSGHSTIPGAVVWSSDHEMQSVWDMLLLQGIDPALQGWTRLTEALDISDDGNTIVGTGVRNGNNEGFIAVIPEPTSIGFSGICIIAVLLHRRRK